MKKSLALLTASLIVCDSIAICQQPPPGYQPFTPPVVGGLPPNSKGLEQPVFVADRELPNMRLNGGGENEVGESFAGNGLGFDETLAIPTLQQMTLFEPGMLVAVVGEEVITAGDLFPPDKLTPQIVASPQFEMMLRKELVEVVTRKALAQRFVNDKLAGKPIKERAQARKHIETQTTKIFYEKWVPKTREAMGLTSDLQLEEELAKKGKTLASMKRDFAETTWAQEHLRESVPEKPLVELSEMQDYYNDKLDSFKRPARVRFQMLSAVFSKYPNKQAAYQAIAEMGNEVFVGGATFEGVAKRKSTDFRASEGGQFDWTSEGALKSKIIDKTIFENPVRGLSQIIEDSDGYHIVEVLERQAASVQSFAEAQAEIRKLLIKQKSNNLKAEFIKKVRDATPVWTKWPADIPGSTDISLLTQ
jgi:hypothetical protein